MVKKERKIGSGSKAKNHWKYIELWKLYVYTFDFDWTCLIFSILLWTVADKLVIAKFICNKYHFKLLVKN